MRKSNLRSIASSLLNIAGFDQGTIDTWFENQGFNEPTSDDVGKLTECSKDLSSLTRAVESGMLIRRQVQELPAGFYVVMVEDKARLGVVISSDAETAPTYYRVNALKDDQVILGKQVPSKGGLKNVLQEGEEYTIVPETRTAVVALA